MDKVTLTVRDQDGRKLSERAICLPSTPATVPELFRTMAVLKAKGVIRLKLQCGEVSIDADFEGTEPEQERRETLGKKLEKMQRICEEETAVLRGQRRPSGRLNGTAPRTQGSSTRVHSR